jgi:hypothetical protein
MDFRVLFPSKYLQAADLEGSDQVVTIKIITPVEEVGQSKDKRPVVYFDGVTKGLVLNKTNAKRIAKLYGNDTAAWIGRPITLYPSECDFGDETVPCLRVRDSVPQRATNGHATQAAPAVNNWSPEMVAQMEAFLAARGGAAANPQLATAQ